MARPSHTYFASDLGGFVFSFSCQRWSSASTRSAIRVNAVCRGLHLRDKFPVSVGEEKAEKATGEVKALGQFDRLPDAVLLDVLDHIGDVKALGRCALVSRRFHALVPLVDSVLVRVDCVIPDDPPPSSPASSPPPSAVVRRRDDPLRWLATVAAVAAVFFFKYEKNFLWRMVVECATKTQLFVAHGPCATKFTL